MISEEQAKNITNIVQKYFEDLEWEKEDVTMGMIWMTAIIISLQLGPIPVPLVANKFPEVLRALANAIELVIQVDKK